MDTKQVKNPMPTPQQRPDLYDDFDGIDRPKGQGTGIKTPDYIAKLIAERQSKQAPKQQAAE